MIVSNSNNINKAKITSHMNSLNTKKTTTYDVRNLGPGLVQAQKCGVAKPVNGMPILELI